MKKLNFLIISLNSVSTVALSVFLVFTLLQINLQITGPYEMGNEFTEIVVMNSFANINENKKLLEEIRTIIEDHEITIILDNIDAMGLAVYDSYGKYDSYQLTEGSYLTTEDFNENIASILVKENSFVHLDSLDKGNVFERNGEKFKVKGVYNIEHPLYTDNHEYIYNYFQATDLSGYYYVETNSDVLIDMFINLFDQHQYITSITKSSSNNILIDIIYRLKGNNVYVTTLFGVFFIYFNYFIFFHLYLIKHRRESLIHIKFGATKNNLLIRYSKGIIINQLSGSILGSILYLLLFSSTELAFSFKLLFIIVIVATFISYLIYVLCFNLQKKLLF